MGHTIRKWFVSCYTLKSPLHTESWPPILVERKYVYRKRMNTKCQCLTYCPGTVLFNGSFYIVGEMILCSVSAGGERTYIYLFYKDLLSERCVSCGQRCRRRRRLVYSRVLGDHHRTKTPVLWLIVRLQCQRKCRGNLRTVRMTC